MAVELTVVVLRRGSQGVCVLPSWRFCWFVDGCGSIVWDRTYSDDDPDDIVANRCELLDEVLRVLDADRIVVAHTVQPRVNSICDGKAWRIDTGIASYYGSNLQAIEIADGFVNTITVR